MAESTGVVLTNDFETDVLSLVSSPKFGSYQKSDLNLLLFHYAMVATTREKEDIGEVDDQLKYFLLDRQVQAELAKRLNLTIGRVKSLIEQSASLYGREPEDDEFAGLIRPLVVKAKPPASWYKDGTVAVIVHNKPLKELIITKLDAAGGFADYSFNQDIMRISAFDLLVLVGKDDDETIRRFLQQARQTEKLPADKRDVINSLANKEVQRANRREVLSQAAGVVGQLSQTLLGAVI